MTPPAASAPSPTVEEGMREAVINGLWYALDMLSARYGEWSPERGHVFHGREKQAVEALREAIELISPFGPIASALAARERERDEARAEIDRLRRVQDFDRRRLSVAEAENASLRASAERMEAARARVDVFGILVHVLENGAPGIKPVMRDALARSAALHIRAALTPKEPNDG